MREPKGVALDNVLSQYQPENSVDRDPDGDDQRLDGSFLIMDFERRTFGSEAQFSALSQRLLCHSSEQTLNLWGLEILLYLSFITPCPPRV